jgi:hypothetical protein
MSDPSGAARDPSLRAPPSNFRRFILGVLIGTAILNASTLLASAADAGVGGFFMGLFVTAGVAVAFRLWGNGYGAGGLAVSLLLSPLLAYPSCTLAFKGF